MAVATLPEIEVRRKLTPDDVWRMMKQGELNDDMFYELVDGELIEMPPAGFEHSEASVGLTTPLRIFSRKSGGRVFDSVAGFLVGRDFQQLRSPDASYWAPNREFVTVGPWVKGAPDLAVEVLSPGQFGETYAVTKIREYFDAGAQLVWFVDLPRREVRVYRPNASEYTIMRGKAVLTLEPIVAGFKLKVSDIFG